MQQVEDGAKAKDGRLFLFVAADWEHLQPFDIKPFVVSKNNTIPVTVAVRENLLMCSCMIVMQGKQCGPLHLALVAHCREWLWSKTTPQMSRREVEGSGMVDYLNIMWCIDADFRLYRNVTSNVGMCQHRAESGGFWDGARRRPATACVGTEYVRMAAMRPATQRSHARLSLSLWCRCRCRAQASGTFIGGARQRRAIHTSASTRRPRSIIRSTSRRR